jgi:hypothetical protein
MPATAERLAILAKARAVRRDKYEKIRELQAFIPKNPVGRPKLRGEKIDLVDNFINKNADKFVFDDDEDNNGDITNDDEKITEINEDTNDDFEEVVEVVEKVPKKKKIIRKIIKYIEEDDDDNEDYEEEVVYVRQPYNDNIPKQPYNDMQMIYNGVPVNTNKINFFNY